MVPHPATPPNDHARSLWPSPQFSDYFSGSEDPTSPENAADQRKVNNPIQSRIIIRLDAIARKVATQDHGTHAPHLLDFDAELSALESRLNAPESQTREIAEETNSGLFADDDEDPAVLQAENEGLRQKVQEGQDIIERITRVRESLQYHYDEMKKTNQFATARLEAASEEIISLKDENEMLRAENETLRSHNARLHTDLHTAIPTIFRLRSQLDTIERQSLAHMDVDPRNKLEKEISTLKHEWHDVEHDFEDIGRRYKKPTARADSAIDPEPSEESDDAADDEERDRDVDEEMNAPAQANGHPSKGMNSNDSKLVDATDAEGGDGEAEAIEETKPVKTPWQELWDSLAEYAGMHNHYED